MVFFKGTNFIFPNSELPTSAGSVRELDVLKQCLFLWMSVTVQALRKTKGTIKSDNFRNE